MDTVKPSRAFRLISCAELSQMLRHWISTFSAYFLFVGRLYKTHCSVNVSNTWRLESLPLNQSEQDNRKICFSEEIPTNLFMSRYWESEHDESFQALSLIGRIGSGSENL